KEEGGGAGASVCRWDGKKRGAYPAGEEVGACDAYNRSCPEIKKSDSWRRHSCLRSAQEEKFEPAVVISRQRGHDAFLANFPPILFIERVADTDEHPCSAVPESHFCSEIPNIISWDEPFERIAVVTKLIVNERTQKRDFETILVAINCPGLYLIIRSVRRRFAIVRSGGKLGVEHRDIAVESEIAVGVWCAAFDERENVQFGGGFKP